MKDMLAVGLLGASLVGFCTPVHAAQPYQEYRKHVESAQTLTALTDDLMGDSVSLYNGATEFTATDISLPGNNALPVQLTRRFSIEITPGGSPGGSAGDPSLRGAGNWDVEVPYISAVYGPGPWEAARCTTGSAPNVPAPLDTTDVWQGNTVHLPGAGSRKMLRRFQPEIPQPSDGVERKWTTRERDMFTCIPMQSASGLAGEGFLMQTASGLRYYFDMATTRSAGYITYQPSPEFQPMSVGRTKYYLLASKIADRFGNTVSFTYNTNGSPTSIASSDGRTITLTYSGTLLTTASVHDFVSGADRSWQYAYGIGAEAAMLKTVTQPDGSTWQYAHVGTLFPDDGGVWDGGSGPNCGIKPPPVSASFNFTITHPSGAVGTFLFANRRQPRSGVHATACVDHLVNGSGTWVHTYKLYIPNYFDVMTLDKKTITGPGIAAKEWTYEYQFGSGALWGVRGQPFTYPCTTCQSEKTIIVYEPSGVTKKYRYGTLYASNEGRLLGTTTIDAAGTVMRIESTAYLPESAASAQNFHPLYGQGFGADDPSSIAVRPVIEQSIQQEGATYSKKVNIGCGGATRYCFDVYGAPTSVSKFSSLGFSKDEITTYFNNTNLWVLGQVASTSIDGVIASQTGYDSLARPTWSKTFGKLQQILTYYSGSTTSQFGTVASVSDGRDSSGFNTTVLLSDWKGGTPQTVTYPATVDQSTPVTQKAVVDDYGSIRSILDENGFMTCYGYDSMGRISQIVYPSESAIKACNNWTWGVTDSHFVKTTPSDDDYGIQGGHWKRVVQTYDAVSVTYYDAFWRSVVEERYDSTDVLNTRSIVVKRYDEDGRLSFQSYPMPSLVNYATVTTGVATTYDALDRVKTVTVPSADSPTGTFVTKSDYVVNATAPYLRLTDPNGNQTRTWFQMFDEPDYSRPTKINHPEGAYTTIERDVFGKPTLLKRQDGAEQGPERQYYYDAYQQLCRTREPETNSTVFDYDNAGNLAWSAGGLDLPETSACFNAQGLQSGRRVDRTYDARNRLKTLAFPDGNGDQTWDYEPDGLVSQIVTDNDDGATLVVNAFSYMHRRLLAGESMAQPGYTWAIGYGYDGYGHIAVSLTQPGGEVVNFAPNALGQATQAVSPYGDYATAVSYWPNGGIKQFTYGNGIVHKSEQNDRQMPKRSVDFYGSGFRAIDDYYFYDGNGNVTDILDTLPTSDGRGDRVMKYDGLNRLKRATSKMFGNTGALAQASYEYDAADNLTRVSMPATALAPARNHYYCYDSAWRLTNVMGGSCSGMTVIGLGYDDQGNLENKSGQHYQFDFGNRLRQVVGKEKYRYDGYGRRVMATSLQGAGDIRSMYGQDGVLRYQRDDKRSKVINYIYVGGSLVASRETPYGTSVNTVKYQHTDALGSPVVVTDSNRVILERSELEPYGKLLNRPLTDGPGYTGHVSDAATGLDYMQQRYYDPIIGRFLSVDPVTADANIGSNFNRYWYANNNPYAFTDPDGRQAACGKNIKCQVDRGAAGGTIQINPSSSHSSEASTSSTSTAGVPSNTPRGLNASGQGQEGAPPEIKPLVSCNVTNTCVPQDQLDNIDLGGKRVIAAVYTAPAIVAGIMIVAPEAMSAVRTPQGREVVFVICSGIGLCLGKRPSGQVIRQRTEMAKGREGSLREARAAEQAQATAP